MSNNQSDYTFSSSQPTNVSVSNAAGTKGRVKFGGSVTITATPINPAYSAVTYTFNPTIWVVPKGSTEYTYANAVLLCGGVTNLPTGADLTNSPQKMLLWGGSGLTTITLER